MDRNTAIEILPVANGFIVREPLAPHQAYLANDFLVFQTIAGLFEYLKGHFSHRGHVIMDDPQGAETDR